MDVTGILNALVSDAETTGLFDQINTHEPKSAPRNGLTMAVWADRIEPYALASGLDATSAVIVFNARLFTKMLQYPQDSIDPNMIIAVDTLMNKYSGDFTLGDMIRNVDLLGETSFHLEAQAGYINQDNTLYRVMTLTIPLIVNDAWTQSP
jgi:hypothetical protein